MSAKKWKVNLTNLTPVQIGDGSVLDPTDYIAREGYVYYLNQINYLSFLLQKSNNALSHALDSSDLTAIIKIMADNFDAGIKEHWKSRTKVSTNFCNLWYDNLSRISSSQQLHRFIRQQANDQPYIPASSLKGVMRTAILDNLAKDEKKRKDIDLALRERRFNSTNAEAILLENLNMRGNFDMTTDPFKYFKVTDALLNENDLFIDSILRYGMSENELPVYYEMVTPETACTFYLEADAEFLKIAPDPVRILRQYNLHLLKKEVEWMKKNDADRFREFYNNLIVRFNETVNTSDQTVIRLGFGSGQWGLSLHYYWKENLKTKAVWNNSLLGWVHLRFEEIR